MKLSIDVSSAIASRICHAAARRTGIPRRTLNDTKHGARPSGKTQRAIHALLQTVRRAVRDAKKVATCLGYGPRFLHSTGQAYKGGPNTGVFLQITCDNAEDLPVPGQRYTFGVVKAAQARGDFLVLAERGRRALRVHLGEDVLAGLEALQAAVQQALA
jgi:hypothetical protein